MPGLEGSGEPISAGQRVVVLGKRKGTAKYVGPTAFGPGLWITAPQLFNGHREVRPFCRAFRIHLDHNRGQPQDSDSTKVMLHDHTLVIHRLPRK
jgi:hypothetical protein